MKSELPKISIVTPSFNQGNFLEQTILSIINQNYPNLEYIIIDGGSTDNSVDIIKKYEKYITYWVSEKDNGQTDAINNGFKIATGDIINWINSDDVLAKNSLNSISKYFLLNPKTDIVFGKCPLIDENDNIIKHRNIISFSSKALWAPSATLIQPATFFRKLILEEIGYLDQSINFVMDQDLYLRMDLANKNFSKVNFIIAYFRIHTNAKSVKLRNSMKKELNYILNVKYKSPYNKHLRKLFWFYFRSKKYIKDIPIKLNFFIRKKRKGLIKYSI